MVSLSQSLCLYLSTSLPPPPSVSFSVSICLSVSVSLFFSLSLFFFTCLCLCLCVSPFLSLRLSNLSFVSPRSLGPTVPPRFVNKVRAVPFVDGEDAQITCTIEGAPYPQIRWARWLGGGAAGGTWACPGAGACGQPVSWVRASYSQDCRLSAEEWV